MNVLDTINKIKTLDEAYTNTPLLYYSYGKDSTVLLKMLLDAGINPIIFSSDVLGCTEFDLDYHNYIEENFSVKIHRTFSDQNNMIRYINAREIMFSHDRSPLEGIAKYLNIMEPLTSNLQYKIEMKRKPLIFQGNTSGNSVIISGNNHFEFQIGNTINPLYDWTDEDSMNYLIDNNIKLHNVYNLGFSKNTCFPCFCWTNGEHLPFLENNIALLKQHFPNQFEKWVKFEEDTGYPFFRKDDWTPVFLKEYK
jgi:3'-phosphoadenosine 5'-phosphosulfate sulfotransferase (PAPS reductase)/FAD synthetase